MMAQLSRMQLIALATAGSFALLAGALMFQGLGYAPCRMCIWQRWPHAIAIGFGVLALVLPAQRKALAYLGTLALLCTAAIGLYHTGVERDWWEGPSSCTGGALDATTNLLDTNIAPIVMCDGVVWSLFGLSMASYNLLISMALAALWWKAASRS